MCLGGGVFRLSALVFYSFLFVFTCANENPLLFIPENYLVSMEVIYYLCTTD